jgi:hypothetical protein
MLAAAFTASSQTIDLNAPFDVDQKFVPSGWMGDGREGEKYLSYNSVFRGRPRPGNTNGLTTRIAYTAGPQRWAGIYWQFPESNWGERSGRRISGAKRIVFWAAGETGREVVEFKAGGIRGRYSDSFEKSLGKVSLSQRWKQYSMPLAGLDTSAVIGAFCVIFSADPLLRVSVIHVDAIRYE